MFLGQDVQRVTENGCTAMRRRAQSNEMRGVVDRAIVGVVRAMVKGDVKGHGELIVSLVHCARCFAVCFPGAGTRLAKKVSKIPLPTRFMRFCKSSRYSCRPLFTISSTDA